MSVWVYCNTLEDNAEDFVQFKDQDAAVAYIEERVEQSKGELDLSDFVMIEGRQLPIVGVFHQVRVSA